MARKPQRCLRSKHLRNILWFAAGGKCRMCGVDLQRDWHADHVVPYSVSGHTNVHEMQALCPACNLKKGASYVVFRQHQKEFDAYLKEVCSGGKCREVVAEITPGGGKSLYPVMATRLIDAGLADFIMWTVPRLSLARQAEVEFSRESEFNPRRHRLRWSTNDADPCRGLSAFTTTHQAIAADASNSVLAAFKARRGILIVDECHHIYRGSSVAQKLFPIREAAAFRFYLSGRLDRWDRKAIADITYRSFGDGVLAVDYECRDVRFIRYPRRLALQEKAKIPIRFAHLDGAVSWLDGSGKPCESPTLRDNKDDSPALFVALQTDYATELLIACEQHFDSHRKYQNPCSKLLSVCFSIKEARKHLGLLSKRRPHLRCGIAVCKDSDGGDLTKESLDIIERYKLPFDNPNAIDVLFTVQMAYEGLDVPSITHIACLTHIRSWQWLEQMFDRGTRFDSHPKAGPWEAQKLYASVPDDPPMNDAVAMLDSEQGGFAQGIKRGCWPSPDQANPASGGSLFTESEDVPGDSLPLNGFVTDTRYSGDIAVDPAEARHLSQLMNRFGLIGSPQDMKAFLLEYRPGGEPAPSGGSSPDLSITPTEEEETIRRRINEYCNKVDHALFADNHGKTNTHVMKAFGWKSREDMKIDELRRVWAFLQREFPL